MPIHKVDGGFQWGNHGKVYHSRAGAEKQAAAAYANGYRGDASAPRARDGRRDFVKVLSGLFNIFAEEMNEPEHAEDDANSAIPAAGVAVRHGDKLLFMRRKDTGDWAFPGGRAEDGEGPEATAKRELKEETGYDAATLKPIHAHSLNGVDFATYVHDVDKEFEPVLNDEHSEYKWASVDETPEPLHPGVKRMLEDAAKETPMGKIIKKEMKHGHPQKQSVAIAYSELGKDETEETKERHEGKLSPTTKKEIGRVGSEHRQDMPDSDFLEPASKKYPVKKDGKYDRNLLLAAAREARMHGHEDLARKADAIRSREFGSAAGGAHDGALAFDRDSVREYDKDGRLHTDHVNISKAAVNPYLGKEIPGYEQLGLDPNKVYKLLRHPDELARAVDTFNGIPVLIKHQPTSAKDHPKTITVGSTGTEAKFDHPHLQNKLSIWDKEGIDGINDKSRKELSCGYHYEPDMTPGTYEGEPYDGIMRNIVGNHVALVKEGRAGKDVVVGDAKFTEGDHPRDDGGKFTAGAGTAAHKHLQKAGQETGSAAEFYRKENPGLHKKMSAAAQEMKGGSISAHHLGSMSFKNLRTLSKHMPKDHPLQGKIRSILKGEPEQTDNAMAGDIRMPQRVSRTAIATEGALRAYLRPRLASDQRFDVKPLLAGLNRKNFGQRLPGIVAGVTAAVHPMLAQDANVGDLTQLLDALKEDLEEEEEGDEELEPAEGEEEPAEDAEEHPALAHLKEHFPEAHEAVKGMFQGHEAHDEEETPEEREKRETEDAQLDGETDEDHEKRVKANDAKRRRAHDRKVARDARRRGAKDTTEPEKEKPITQDELNAAVSRAVKTATAQATTTQRQIFDAMRTVRPWVGELHMSFDSAEQVFAHALKARGVSVKGVHPSAYRAILEAQPKPGTKSSATSMATDSAGAKGFAERFPGAARIQQV